MKLNATQTHIKVPLACLRITTNVRTGFDEAEIAELAQSIRENGLINAITVKPPVTDENGDKTYEVIAGGRRIRACQWLCDHGDDFSMIDCKISTGDMWTIQMIENIQRTDLTPREKENAIALALDEGMSQKEIAEKLSKPQTYISDIVAGMKVRKIADAAYLSTDTISTKALAQLRSIPESEINGYIVQLSERGGTVSVATELLHEWQEEQRKAAEINTPHDDFVIETPATPESNEEAESDIIGSAHFTPGDIINAAGKRLFFDDLKIGMQFVHASDEQSHMFLRVCEVTEINADTEQAFYTDGDRSCGHGTINKKDVDSDKNEHDSWIYAIPGETHEEKAETALTITYEVPEQTKHVTDISREDFCFRDVPATASVSSRERGHMVYGVFDLSGKKHKLYLDGRYSNDDADEIAAELQTELFPAASWFVEEL